MATPLRGSPCRELVDGGFPRDVDLALEQEVSSSAPLLIDGAYRAV
jgi:hypothetical protein